MTNLRTKNAKAHLSILGRLSFVAAGVLSLQLIGVGLPGVGDSPAVLSPVYAPGNHEFAVDLNNFHGEILNGIQKRAVTKALVSYPNPAGVPATHSIALLEMMPRFPLASSSGYQTRTAIRIVRAPGHPAFSNLATRSISFAANMPVGVATDQYSLPFAMTAGDLDLNNQADLVLGFENNSRIGILRNFDQSLNQTGPNQAADQTMTVVQFDSAQSTVSSINVGLYNNDALPDIAIVANYQSTDTSKLILCLQGANFTFTCSPMGIVGENLSSSPPGGSGTTQQMPKPGMTQGFFDTPGAGLNEAGSNLVRATTGQYIGIAWSGRDNLVYKYTFYLNSSGGSNGWSSRRFEYGVNSPDGLLPQRVTSAMIGDFDNNTNLDLAVLVQPDVSNGEFYGLGREVNPRVEITYDAIDIQGHLPRQLSGFATPVDGSTANANTSSQAALEWRTALGLLTADVYDDLHRKSGNDQQPDIIVPSFKNELYWDGSPNVNDFIDGKLVGYSGKNGYVRFADGFGLQPAEMPRVYSAGLGGFFPGTSNDVAFLVYTDHAPNDYQSPQDPLSEGGRRVVFLGRVASASSNGGSWLHD